MNKKVVMVVVIALLLCVGVAGGAWWWVQQQSGGTQKVIQAPKLDASQPKYVVLDKIVVMLRPEEGRSNNTYLSLDMVFRTDKTHEKTVKGDLPMLKGVAVRTLSKLEVSQARAMSIEEWTDLLNREVMAAYEGQQDLRFFDQVMVSRLIIE